jgi:two-component system, chemotaxis family, chemotaxis protein CheY
MSRRASIRPHAHGALKESGMSPAKNQDLETGPTILVIDDDEAVRSSLEVLLEAYGYEVVLARDGRQGMAAFRANTPDIVLVDLMMPVQDGIETIVQIRAEWPDAYIIAMSGGARIGNWDGLAVARELGADYAIEKPFEADELLVILQQATATS